MPNEITPNTSSSEIVLYQPNDNIKLDVRINSDTVWLTRNQMATLFGRDVKTIGKHINNALREELASSVVAKNATLHPTNPTVAKFAIVQNEGGRMVEREVEHYSLDMILSVGYRVHSPQGIAFRVWANQVLKQYLLRGYSVNHQLIALQQHVDERLIRIEDRLQHHDEQIAFFIRTNQPPIEGIFYEGQELDARTFEILKVRNPQCLSRHLCRTHRQWSPHPPADLTHPNLPYHRSPTDIPAYARPLPQNRWYLISPRRLTQRTRQTPLRLLQDVYTQNNAPKI